MVTVLLLDGRRVQVECDVSKTRIQQVFNIAVDHVNIAAADVPFFGLSTIRNGDFIFPKVDEKVACLAPDHYNQLPFDNFNVHLRFR